MNGSRRDVGPTNAAFYIVTLGVAYLIIDHRFGPNGTTEVNTGLSFSLYVAPDSFMIDRILTFRICNMHRNGLKHF